MCRGGFHSVHFAVESREQFLLMGLHHGMWAYVLSHPGDPLTTLYLLKKYVFTNCLASGFNPFFLSSYSYVLTSICAYFMCYENVRVRVRVRMCMKSLITKLGQSVFMARIQSALDWFCHALASLKLGLYSLQPYSARMMGMSCLWKKFRGKNWVTWVKGLNVTQ